MNVVVVTEHRFRRTPDGAVWTPTGYTPSFWKRYLDVFDHVRVFARVRDVDGTTPDLTRADGERVSFAPVPYYLGPWQYLRMRRRVIRAARGAVRPDDAVILRVGSQIAACVEPMLQRTGHPYGVEVVGDPYDVFAPGAVRHPLRRPLRWWFSRRLKRLCSRACAAAYVNEHTLQRRYPPAAGAFATHYSSIDLPVSAFLRSARCRTAAGHGAKLVTIGSLEQLYKAPDVLIDAVALCVADGVHIELKFVGNGACRPMLEAQVAGRGLSERIRFLGQLPAGEAVRRELDESDLFVLPSKTEGLPRAMIEAMARALPCVGSTVGGIPELLPQEDLVPPGDVHALARKIREVVADPGRMARMSARNLEKAKEYREEILRKRRIEYYRHLRDKTKEALERRHGRPTSR